MHILLVADGRSPITRRWLESVTALGHQVSLVSTFPCQQPPGVENLFILPVAFSNFASGGPGPARSEKINSSSARKLVKNFRSVLLTGRYYLGPLSLLGYIRKYQQIVEELKPDLVHALRIPYEGMLGSYTPRPYPFAVSIWGNDLTLHAHGSPWMRSLTHRTLKRADGLMADAARDLRLAQVWGFSPKNPMRLVPGNGGIDLNRLHKDRVPLAPEFNAKIPIGMPLVINPRGIRPAYAKTDIFFQAIPLAQERRINTAFICPGMAGQAEAQRWVHRLKLDERVVLLPPLPQGQLWDLFSRCAVSISLTIHDGTPNTLLEAMAYGSYPIAGDIDSLREWITPGENGLLVEPTKPQALAEGLVKVLENPAARSRAAQINLERILDKAEVSQVRPQIEIFYQWVAGLG